MPIHELCDRDGRALSEAFGNFDRRVALGWLLADAAGMPLLDRPSALAIGVKAQRANSAAKAAVREARKKAIAPARAAGMDVSQAQDAAEAAVLCADAKVIALQQPSINASAARAPTGSRKRSREPEPSHEQEERIAEDCLLKAQKRVSRAENQLEKAMTATDAARVTLQAVIERQPPDRPWEIWQRWHNLFEKCSDRHDEAEHAEKDAEIELLRAQLDERDAQLDLVMLLWARSNTAVESVTDIASRATQQLRLVERLQSEKNSAVARSDLGSAEESESDP